MKKLTSLLATLLLLLVSPTTAFAWSNSLYQYTFTPGVFSWAGGSFAASSLTLSGLSQSVSPTTPTLTVQDCTGDANGFHVTVSGTQFTETTPGSGYAVGTSALTLPFDSFSYFPGTPQISNYIASDFVDTGLTPTNPGFESGLTGWSMNTSPTVTGSVSTTVHSGSQSFNFSSRVSNMMNSPTAHLSSSNITVSPGQALYLTAWVESTNYSTIATASEWGQIYFYNGFGNVIGSVKSGSSTATYWNTVSVNGVAPAGTTHAVVQLWFLGTSTSSTQYTVGAFFDDVSVLTWPGGGPATSTVHIDDPTPQTIMSAPVNMGMGNYSISSGSGTATLSFNPATTYVDTVNYPTSATPYASTITWTLISGP